DGQGLTGSSQISVTVTPPPPGNTAPLVSITAPASGQTLASSATITFTGSASDLEDGDLTAAIAWTSDRDGALGTGGTITHTLSDGTWQESTITFNNRPAVDGPTVASQGPVRLGQTVDFNVGSAVTGDGTYNFALVNTSADECDYRSREGGPAPTLIVTVARA